MNSEDSAMTISLIAQIVFPKNPTLLHSRNSTARPRKQSPFQVKLDFKDYNLFKCKPPGPTNLSGLPAAM